MAITDKKGINVTSGFKLISPSPIDARYVVDDETELQTIVSSGATYNGLIVWVNSLGKAKQFNGTSFVDIAGGLTEQQVNELIDAKIGNFLGGES